MVTPLRPGPGHMSVDDSAEEFISIHALERERLACFVMWSYVKSSQNSVFRPLGDDTVFVSVFCTNAFLAEA